MIKNILQLTAIHRDIFASIAKNLITQEGFFDWFLSHKCAFIL